ncbi:P-loop containing nucleoside triphosphate hydrolase protein [Pyronema omphalodes]|nr:P-loop containing nucleoside triphosphate hydrolase protein [Pyronema omphalodes]
MASNSTQPLLPSKTTAAQLPKRPKNRPPTAARFILDELRGDAGFVSEDIWRDVFGFQKKATVTDKKLEDIDLNEEPEDEPLPPTLYIAITPMVSAASTKSWTILPVTVMPTSSQFPSLPPCTVLIPSSMNIGALADLKLPMKKPVGVYVSAVNPAYLDTIIVSVKAIPGAQVYESDHDIEDRVKDALAKVKIVHSGEPLRLDYGRGLPQRTAKIALTEPLNQGFLKTDTKIVVVKEQPRTRRRRGGQMQGSGVILGGSGDLSEDSDASADSGLASDGDSEEDGLEFSTFLTAPSSTTAVSFPSMSSTPGLMRNGIQSPTNQPPPKKTGKIFKPQPLTSSIPPSYLHPKPKEGDDDEARIFVKVGDLAKLGVFSGDWIKIAPAPASLDEPPTSPLRIAAESAARGRVYRPTSSDGRNGSRGLPSRDQNAEKEIPGRPVRVFSLPESWEAVTNAPKSSRKGKNPALGNSEGRIVYLSPVLLANLLPDDNTADLLLSPLPSVPPSASSVLHSNTPAFPPPAKEVTLLRIASPTSTDRALQHALLLQLKSYFESCRRLVKVGDLIAVSIDEVLARSLYSGGEDDGVTEELLASSDNGRKNCVAWFRVGNIVSSASEEDLRDSRSPSGRRGDRGQVNSEEKEDPWGGVVFVDPASTRMVQAGSEKRKIPPTMNSTWENYLGLRPPPLREAAQIGRPHHITMPSRFISNTQRRLRELIAAATSPRALKMNLQPIAILITSTQRDIGKRTLAQAAAADVGVHVFHIDAYDIIADGGAGDTKTEAYLRARVDRALSCGKETCVLLITHIEALTAGKMGEVLKEIVSDLKIVIATTTEVDKLSDTVRNVFTHELEVGAPDEKERAALLSAIVDEKKVRLAKDVDVSTIAVKTAALVAGDLADVLDRAQAASKSRIAALAKRLKSSSPCLPHEQPSISDLQLAGGDLVTAICRVDFDVAVEAARRNFSDSIGAPRIPNVSWDDVGGLSNVKYAVMETIQLPLERPELFAKGMKKRSGILFYGPPGTGKTLLAKAIATEFSLNFFSIKGPELLNMYIGESEANVRRVFQRARDARPCVVFFDELDSVAPKRGNQGDSGGVMDRIVSQLLAELDGMSEGKEGAGGVFVIGATNRPDLLDPALLRPGRFDKMLYLGVSDTHEKQLTILEALTRKFTIAEDCNLADVAETLPFTYTGADLYALCSDAMLKAITRQAMHVDTKIQELEKKQGSKISTAWFFDNAAKEEDVKVVVSKLDFEEARRELVGSVSAKELEHYQRVRAQFEQPDQMPGADKGKGKAIEYPSDTEEVQGKGKGKALVLEAVPNGWEDPAGNDDEELYGE